MFFFRKTRSNILIDKQYSISFSAFPSDAYVFKSHFLWKLFMNSLFKAYAHTNTYTATNKSNIAVLLCCCAHSLSQTNYSDIRFYVISVVKTPSRRLNLARSPQALASLLPRWRMCVCVFFISLSSLHYDLRSEFRPHGDSAFFKI